VIWRCRHHTFDLDAAPRVMGVLNVTPDSFSDGGRHLDPARAVARAREMIAEGADLLDIGAESTRPGSVPVPAEEQWRRLAPVLEGLAGAAVEISVDTARADVAERAIAAGAGVVNDVTALGDPRMAGVVARAGVGLVLMHMRGTPATMQDRPAYADVVTQVRAALEAAVARARTAGVAAEHIAVDPGIGFGKTVGHNLELLAGLGALAALERPVLVGLSRKHFIGSVLDRDVHERLEGGLAAAAVAVFQGADIVRTHDVRETVPAARMAHALRLARRTRASPVR
jgi:dihydropteroate synthase